MASITNCHLVMSPLFLVKDFPLPKARVVIMVHSSSVILRFGSEPHQILASSTPLTLDRIIAASLRVMISLIRSPFHTFA